MRSSFGKNMTPIDFTATRSIAATPSKVWQAIIDPSKVSQYHFAPLRVLEPTKDGKISYGTDDEEMFAGRIVDIIPNERLTHTFLFSPNQERTKNDPETTVSYLIEAKDHDTTLTLIHTGFPEENQTYANISGGWPYILDALKAFLDKK
jgi:uncharacterized protein YndB with AHSA1/START domain